MEEQHTVQNLQAPPHASLTQEELEGLDDQALLELYKQTGDQELKWALVLRFTGLVRRIAAQASGLYSNFAQLDDIVHEGVLVLSSAIDKFDLSKNVKFETYVSKRLRGMIVDLARRQDWLPRQVRQKATRLTRAMDELSVQLGRAPESREVAEYMGLTQEQYNALLSDTAVSSLVSFEAALDTYGSATEKMMLGGEMDNPPEEQFQERELCPTSYSTWTNSRRRPYAASRVTTGGNGRATVTPILTTTEVRRTTSCTKPPHQTMSKPFRTALTISCWSRP